MHIVFASNYYNHHQKGLSESIYKLTSREYTFLATSVMSEERKQLGYGESVIPDFVIDARIEPREKIQEILEVADAVIVGSVNKEFMNLIKKNSKLMFRYSERILRKKENPVKRIYRFIKFRANYNKNFNNYLLCAGAYTANDYAKFGLYKNRMYKWGYFPETIKYNDIDCLINNKKKNKLLWCGRLLELKHPDHTLEIAKRLKNDGYIFELNIIGNGELTNYLNELVKEYQLESYVTLLGAMKPAQVRECMESTGIYLFTSDNQEGWGAVLNEAMNSGCAVVASNVVGSVPYLFNDGENGLVYKSGDLNSLYEKVKLLLDDYSKQEILGKAAYKTIVDEWNAEIAAERFLNLTEHILNGNVFPDLYETGPCSKALIIND